MLECTEKYGIALGKLDKSQYFRYNLQSTERGYDNQLSKRRIAILI